MRKKERRKSHEIAIFKVPGSDMYNNFTYTFLVSVDRKFAGDYDYVSLRYLGFSNVLYIYNGVSRPSLLIESTDSMMIILCVQVTLLQIEGLLFYFLTYINIVIMCIRTVSVATCICARSLDYKETPIVSHSYCFLMCLPHSVWFKCNIICICDRLWETQYM